MLILMWYNYLAKGILCRKFQGEKGKSVKKCKINVKMLILTIICAVLTLSLIFSVLFILKQNDKINETKATLAKAESANSALTSAKDSYESQLTEKDKKISALESQVTYLEKLKAEKQNQSSQSAKPAVDSNAAAKKALLEAEAKKLANQKAAANGQKLCFLTFDDGPCKNTGEILRILKEKDAKATFFVTNQTSAKDHRHYLKKIVADGHAIGIHTATHDYNKIYKSETAFFNDFNEIGNIIKEEVGYFPKITRFPGGSSISRGYDNGIVASKLVYKVYEKGYQYFDWNVSSGDATTKSTSDTITANVLNGARGKDSICVLMHDLHKKTAQALPAIIDGLRAQGFVFMPLTVDNYGYHHRPY